MHDPRPGIKMLPPYPVAKSIHMPARETSNSITILFRHSFLDRRQHISCRVVSSRERERKGLRVILPEIMILMLRPYAKT